VVQPGISGEVDLSGKFAVVRGVDFEVDMGGAMRLLSQEAEDPIGVRILQMSIIVDGSAAPAVVSQEAKRRAIFRGRHTMARLSCSRLLDPDRCQGLRDERLMVGRAPCGR
jgi:hypothetical protein